MFGNKKKNPAERTPTIEQKKILNILLRRLADDTGKYDVEVVWVISRLAQEFAADHIVQNYQEGDNDDEES